MLAVEAVPGPLDEAGLADVARRYGAADPKYGDLRFLRHLLVDGPGGPALHAFARVDGRAVGHCCVVPLPAQRGDEPLRSGKVEALAVDEAEREAAVDGRPVTLALLERLYALADERGIDVLHAYASRELGVLHRLLGFRALEVGAPSLVAALPGRALAAEHGARAVALAAAQTALRLPWLRPATIRDPLPADAELLPGTGLVRGGSWTIPAAPLWDWWVGSGLLRAVEREGSFRALLQLGGPARSVRLLGAEGGTAALAAAIGAARGAGAATLRLQPDERLARAARPLGLVARPDLTTLYVRSARPELLEVELSPGFTTLF
jgi:hypothetical protein